MLIHSIGKVEDFGFQKELISSLPPATWNITREIRSLLVQTTYPELLSTDNIPGDISKPSHIKTH